MSTQQQQIDNFLRPLLKIISKGNGDGNGYGNGNGNGNGYGNGYGYGNGDGDGNGNGNGNGNGYGNGYGNGNGYGSIKSFNSQKIYIIDDIETIIQTVRNDIAKGFILNDNLTLEKCYIVRNEYYYSHGKTLKEALKSLEEKINLNLPIEKRVENFKNTFKNYNLKQKASLLYDWHFKLTGSCKTGRDYFITNHNINLNKDKFTIYEFIKLTENHYGSDIINQLKKNNDNK